MVSPGPPQWPGLQLPAENQQKQQAQARHAQQTFKPPMGWTHHQSEVHSGQDWSGSQLSPGTRWCLQWLHFKGLKFQLLAENATKPQFLDVRTFSRTLRTSFEMVSSRSRHPITSLAPLQWAAVQFPALSQQEGHAGPATPSRSKQDRGDGQVAFHAGAQRRL